MFVHGVTDNLRMDPVVLGGERAVSIAEVVTGVLEPYVGRVVADTCVRATALSVGKTADALCAEDLASIEANVRRLLMPIASSSTVDGLIATIEGQVS